MALGRRQDAEQHFSWTAKCEHLHGAAAWDLNFRLQRILPQKRPKKKKKRVGGAKKKKLQMLKKAQPGDTLKSYWKIRIQVQIFTKTSSRNSPGLFPQ